MKEKVCLACCGEGHIEHFIVDENGNLKIVDVECDQCYGKGVIFSDDCGPNEGQDEEMEQWKKNIIGGI